ncbi:hypothetical protein ULMA_22130 [Patiriisocius marinus]|uniref:Uncharacterized protein n=1 Tax=Patiriisocius marinus TaxID=1397112 RepID=A0A5J4IQJ3_9FLAO|nr:hypothetical protein [Patiriisocius marinus]GER60105.1 hypothetical protein ULMA_22130 [Patiriisocius marinus]
MQQTFNHFNLITSYEVQSDSVNNANDEDTIASGYFQLKNFIKEVGRAVMVETISNDNECENISPIQAV